MILEVGKRYFRRSGEISGEAYLNGMESGWPYNTRGSCLTLREDGCWIHPDVLDVDDLVAEFVKPSVRVYRDGSCMCYGAGFIARGGRSLEEAYARWKQLYLEGVR